MSLLAPLWLIGLLPWGMVVYWLLQRRRRPTGIPFVELWRGPFHPPKPTRQFDRPPLAVAMVMLATLLAIVAAARPSMSDPAGRRTPPIPVVVDRGAGMSAGATPRMTAALQELQRETTKAGVVPRRRVSLYTVPNAGVNVSDVGELSNPFPLTAANTRAAVAATAARALGETSGPVIVVSDQSLEIASDRLIQVPPPGAPFRNVGIARVAARAVPRPQVMVTVGARGWTDPVKAIVSSDGIDTTAMVDAPADGQQRDVFVDVPKLGKTVQARLDVSDDARADDTAWLVREGTWPRVEARTALDPAVQRVIESYAATRPPGDGSRPLLVVGDGADAAGAPAAVVPAGRDGKSTSGAFVVSPHPVTRDVDFGTITDATFVTDPPAGWTPVVRRRGDVWVAVRELPARQVWVGFGGPDWARTPAFVVFWAGLLDWVGGGGAEVTYSAVRVGDLGPEWKPGEPNTGANDARLWPGLFSRGDGTVRASNSGLVLPGGVSSVDWRPRLRQFQSEGRLEWGPYALLAALGLALVAAMTWRRASLTEISGKTTVAADGVLTEVRAARAETKVRLTRMNPDD